jgi:hypothetical protein
VKVLAAPRNQRSIIIDAAITVIIKTAITMRCSGLLVMCRNNPNRVPSGSKAMPHFGHLPGFGCRMSECIGQT